MKNKFLIFLIILIALLVGGLGYYTYFIYEKGEEVVIEKVDLTESEISTVLYGFPYDKLLDATDKTVSDLTEEEILLIGYYGLSESDVIENSMGDCDDTSTDTLVACLAAKFGLSDSLIEAMDTTLWEDNFLAGQDFYEMFSKELINRVISNRLNLANQFSESFTKIIEIECGSVHFIDDDNIDMFFFKGSGGCALSSTYTILLDNGTKEGDTYIVYMTGGNFEPYDSEDVTYYKLYAKSDEETIVKDEIVTSTSTSEMESYVEEYKDQLDNYKLTFKKVGDNYQFVSIEMVN